MMPNKIKKKNQFVEVGKLKEALRSENDNLSSTKKECKGENLSKWEIE